jgi:hypothetical protein
MRQPGKGTVWLQEQLDTRDRTAGCWEWPFYKDKDGYGNLRMSQPIRSGAASLLLDGQEKPFVSAQALHTCDNPSCVNPTHLYWGTHAQNMADKSRRQRIAGSANCHSKLTEAQVLAIRTDPRFGTIIARDYGVAFSTIYRIKNRMMWTHI